MARRRQGTVPARKADWVRSVEGLRADEAPAGMGAVFEVVGAVIITWFILLWSWPGSAWRRPTFRIEREL